MPEIDFLAFATGAGANVISQTQYAALAALPQGFGAGLAASAQFNKVWRQSSFVAAALAQFIATNANVDVLDDGNLNEFIAKFETALAVYLQQSITIRIRLLASTQFYVNALSGNDSNTGSSSAPWQTLQRAANYIWNNLDLNGYPVTVNCSGAFTAGISITGFPLGLIGPQQITFSFASGSTISTVSTPCFQALFGASFLVQGPVTLSVSGSPVGELAVACWADPGTRIFVGSGVIFGTCTQAHMYGNIEVVGSYSISGASAVHIDAAAAGHNLVYSQASPITVTLSGTPAFSTSFVRAINSGAVSCFSSNVTFSGVATGVRYTANHLGQIYTAGAPTTFFPGSVAGVADATTFGLYS